MKKLFLFLFLTFYSFFALYAQVSVFEVKDNSLLQDNYLDIKTNCDFFYGKFISPAQQDATPDIIVKIPSSWNKYKINEQANNVLKTGAGSGTYKLLISNLKPYTSYCIPTTNLCSTAFALYADSKLIFTAGEPYEDYKKTKADRTIELATFTTNETGTVSLTFFVSNEVYRKGGLRKSLRIAEESFATQSYNKQIIIYSILFGLLCAIIFYSIMLFVLEKNITHCFLTLLEIAILTRIVAYIFPLIKYFFPNIPMSIIFRLDYVAIFCAPAFYTLYMHSLNKKLFSRIKLVHIVTPAIIFFILDFTLPVKYANRLVPFMQGYFILVTVLEIILLMFRIIKDKDSLSLYAVVSFFIVGIGVLSDIIMINNLNRLMNISLLSFSFAVYEIIQVAMLSYLQNRDLRSLVLLNEHLEQINKSYYRFVPHRFLMFLHKKDITEVQVGEHRISKMTVLSADIRNFTSLSEAMSEKQVFDMLNSYLSVITPVIIKYNGIIEKYLGDGIIVIFPNSSKDALCCAVEMQESMIELRKDFVARGLPEIRIGIGIHFGTITIGTVGNGNRMTELALSDAVDVAVRAESDTKKFNRPIIVTEQALSSAQAQSENKELPFYVKEIEQTQSPTLYYIYNDKIGDLL